MYQKYASRTTFACFSPPVMLATFLIETTLALYVLWRYRLTHISRLAIAVLIALAVFQLAEYNICETTMGFSSLDWARIGFISITLLPPLGIHLGLEIAGVARKYRRLLTSIYVLAAGFAIAFLTVGHGIQDGAACLGNYAIFHVAPTTIRLYGLYYYGLLLLGMGLSFYHAKKSNSEFARYSLYSLIVGYAVFLLPTTTINIIDPVTVAGIPSIMCGFAVLLAIAIVGFVLPYSAKAGKR